MAGISGEPPVTIIRDGDNDNSTAGSSFVDLTIAGNIDGGNTSAGDAPGTGEPGTDGPAPYGFRADGKPAKKRGRKPGATGTGGGSSKNRSAATDSVTVKGLEKILFSVHMMAAAALKTPELALDNSEASMMAKAVNDVQEYYNFDLSEEVTLWVNLVSASVAVYGPRAVAIMARKKAESKKSKEPKAAPMESAVASKEAVDKTLDMILNPAKYTS